MIVLVTGSQGFVGKHLVMSLLHQGRVLVWGADRSTSKRQLQDWLQEADIVFHLAGVIRPSTRGEYTPGEYMLNNVDFTQEILDHLIDCGRRPKIVFASSKAVGSDSPYARSKVEAESKLKTFSEQRDVRVTIFRWTNLFGGWGRPDYNSVVATFCYNVARGIPLWISDPSKEIELAYVDDAVAGLLAELDGDTSPELVCVKRVEPTCSITLGTLAETIQSFCNLRTIPPGDYFTRCLYSTYLSYLPDPMHGNVDKDTPPPS